MGLDMYFYARKNNYKHFGFYDQKDGGKDTTAYPVDLKELGESVFKTSGARSVCTMVDYRVGYFRKFNALHNYIVDHYADGVDQCQPIYLTKNEVADIRDTLKKVLEDKHHAPDILPTGEGFFFGSTDYDDYYFDDVKDAYDLFTSILEKLNFDKYSIIYQASW